MAKAQVKEDTQDKEGFVDELKPGTKLMHGQYTIDNFLNAGGFGITYLASDSLDRKVVIKECFPGAFCRRSRYVVQARSRAHQNELKSIVRLFVQEARSLAKLDHPNIVGVHQVFEDNDTAYMALDFVEGRDLLDTIEDPNHGLTAPQIKTILKEVLGAVGFIHDQGMLHRDISPDNILINKELHPVLIDFGAAREEATKQSRVLSALRVVKDGYSPQEFYIAGSDQSPSSDLYALAASFHHLIVGDVPPNSQARLAAIASGDTDPYEPIVGRFKDYDDNFLGAIDKALAVLPKDRVQTAQEWLDMMEGGATNVTALNVGNNAAAAVAAPATEQKSKMPLLLGSAAAVALLVGVGVVSMTGGDDAPVAEAPVAVAPAAEAPASAVVAEAPAADSGALVLEAPAADTDALVLDAPAVDTDALVLDAPAVDTDALVLEAPAEATVAEAPETVAPTATENTSPTEEAVAAAVAEAVEAPATLPFAVPETATPAPAPVTETPPAPELAVDPAVPATEGTTDVVSTPEIADTLTPTVRPTPRPEAVELAAVPAPIPLPEPVVTPSPAADATVETQTLPALPAEAPTVATTEFSFSAPTTPEAVAAVGNGPIVDIVAVTPGNEIAPDNVVANWNVRMPFVAAGPNSNVIAEAAAVSPTWVEPGLVVTGINGNPVDAISDIPGILRGQIDPADQSPTVTVMFNTLDTATDEALSQLWVLPVVQEMLLIDGTRFETVFTGSGWTTSVADMPNAQNGGLAEGDILTSYIATGEVIDGRDTLVEIFNRELAAGTDQFTFAVQRAGSLWVASFGYGVPTE